jgi:crossover junction endodeoxyribonuclease RuvC
VRILGIDPGSIATGFGVVDQDGSRLRHVASGVIRPGAGELAERLARIHEGLETLVQLHAPDNAALEAVFVSRNPRSALQLGHARGVALVVCGRAGLATAEYAPSTVKGAVAGYGRADKPQVQAMVQRLLGLASAPARDAADALAVAICHAAQSRRRAALGRATGAEVSA